MLIQKSFIRFSEFTTDIYEGAQNKIQGILKHSQKMSALMLAGKVFVFTILLSSIPMGNMPVKAQSYDTAVKLDKNNPFILSTDAKTTQIEIGESNFNREEREKNQAKLVKSVSSVKVESPIEESHQDPSDFRPIYMAAAQQFGIPWQLIEAVHQVESGKSGSTAKRSGAGAQGPMQFMPGTWRAYEVDGNGDGQAEITDVVDAIYTAAHYLARSGADEGRIDDALYNYNHSQSYVNKVKSIAYEIGL